MAGAATERLSHQACWSQAASLTPPIGHVDVAKRGRKALQLDGRGKETVSNVAKRRQMTICREKVERSY